MKIRKPHPSGQPNRFVEVEVPEVKRPLPCRHVGDPSGPKGWHLCDHPNAQEDPSIPSGNVVCSCTGCGPNCRGYVGDDAGRLTTMSPFAKELHDFVDASRCVDYPSDRFKGTGIVVSAGGWNGLAGVYLLARMLRWEAVNSRLPIEAWYVGDEGEFDPIFQYVTAEYGVVWRNVSEELRRLGIARQERLHGWAIKPLALMLSGFERVVMMDADCYPVYDPERLFSDPRIASKPAAFWPDNPVIKAGSSLDANQWRTFGMDLPKQKIPGFESGQMIVDKKRSWHAVQVAAWMSDRMNEFDGTRGAANGVHGDKEIFSVAWRLTETPYHMAPPVDYHEVAFFQHDPDGRTAFVHRCNDKPRLIWSDLKHTSEKIKESQWRSATIPHDHYFHHCMNELRHKFRPNVPGFRDGTQDEQIWREVHVVNTYRLPKRIDGWNVLDVGAHAGFFALECLSRGASSVVCLEPYRPNNELLRQNLGTWTASGKVEVQNLAVGWKGQTTVRVTGSDNGDSYTGEPHVSETSGTAVPCVDLDTLIVKIGHVDLLKLDCEGGEYGALLDCTKLMCVDRVYLEWHTHDPSYDHWELYDKLAEEGFAVETMDMKLPTGMMWATRGPRLSPPAASPVPSPV